MPVAVAVKVVDGVGFAELVDEAGDEVGALGAVVAESTEVERLTEMPPLVAAEDRLAERLIEG